MNRAARKLTGRIGFRAAERSFLHFSPALPRLSLSLPPPHPTAVVATAENPVEKVRRERSKLRAKLAVGALLAIAALLVAAAFASAAPLTVTATVDYARSHEVAVAVIRIVINGTPGATYGVEVRGPANETVALKEVEADANGLAVLELELPETYPAGAYTVYVAGGGEFAVATFTVSWNATAPAAPCLSLKALPGPA